MTREDKELLLKDLCARLSYGVKVQVNGEICTLIEIDYEESSCGVKHIDRHLSGEDIEKVNPYLRPMESMTEEEAQDMPLSEALHSSCYVGVIDWLNEHHFDYRGLIEKGLALEAPENMYGNKQA